MNVQLEQIFFKFITQKNEYIEIVEPNFFQKREIKIVYESIREYLLKDGKKREYPTKKQIAEMVREHDTDKILTKDILVSILNYDIKEFSIDDFILPRFNMWVFQNKLDNYGEFVVDKIRDIKNIKSLDKLQEVINTFKDKLHEVSSISINDDDSLGSDFDDVESHVQDSSILKVKTGYSTLDHILGGGWDISTLNILMGQTNAGKSMWMQNMAVKAADMGYDALYITLEMSEKKCIKRFGSMRLKIPIYEYDEMSKDTEYMREKINALHKSSGYGFMETEQRKGKLLTKFWSAGTSTINDYDNFLTKLYNKKGIKPRIIFIDYLTLTAPLKGLGIEGNLYQKGKHLAEGYRALAAKWEVPIVTGIQVSKDAWNQSDVTMESVPESKAIIETSDTFWAIIRTEEMKRDNKYTLKLLKQRDGDFSRERVNFDFDPKYLLIHNDQFI